MAQTKQGRRGQKTVGVSFYVEASVHDEWAQAVQTGEAPSISALVRKRASRPAEDRRILERLSELEASIMKTNACILLVLGMINNEKPSDLKLLQPPNAA